MNKTRRQVLYGAALLGLAGCGGSSDTLNPASAQTPTLPPPTPGPGTSGRLYVAYAEGGTISGNVLTLIETRSNVVWFEDRPGRRAGRQSTASFVADWSSLGFASVPPNAALEVGGRSLPIILRDPVYDAGTGTLRFVVEADQGAQLSSVPSAFSDVSLFIDSGASPSSTKEILLEAASLPGLGGLQVAITEGSVSFALDGDPSHSAGQGDSISQFGLSSSSVYAFSGVTTPQKVTLKLRLQSTAPGGTFTLVNGSSSIVVTAQVPTGATPQVVAATGTQFAW